MAIKIKAVERLLKFDKNQEGNYRYVMQPQLYNRLTVDKVIEEAMLRSGVAPGPIRASWDAIGDIIRAWALEGHSVPVPGLGTMRFGIRAQAVEKLEDVSTKLIRARRVIFTPNVATKQVLAKTSINITCYDRNGNVQKDITPEGEVELDEGDTTAGTKHTLTLKVNPGDSCGSVTGAGEYNEGAVATITATPAEGYEFVRWSDNDTNAMRAVTVNDDMELTAYFAEM